MNVSFTFVISWSQLLSPRFPRDCFGECRCTCPSPWHRAPVKLCLYGKPGFSEPWRNLNLNFFSLASIFFFKNTLNIVRDFLAGHSLGIMSFLSVQVGNSSHKLTLGNALHSGEEWRREVSGFVFVFSPHFLQFHFKISSKLSAPSLVGLLHPLCPSGLRLPASINKGDEQGSVALLLGRPWQLAGSRLSAFSLSPWLPASPKDTTLLVCSLPAWSFLTHPSLKSPDLFSALLNKSL